MRHLKTKQLTADSPGLVKYLAIAVPNFKVGILIRCISCQHTKTFSPEKYLTGTRSKQLWIVDLGEMILLGLSAVNYYVNEWPFMIMKLLHRPKWIFPIPIPFARHAVINDTCHKWTSLYNFTFYYFFVLMQFGAWPMLGISGNCQGKANARLGHLFPW